MLQYEMKKRSRYRSIDDVTPPDAPDVLSYDEFLELWEQPNALVSLWDFNTGLGTSLREKYETLAFKILEMAGLIANNLEKSEKFWAALHPTVGAVLHGAFENSPRLVPMGGNDPVYLGVLCGRVEIYQMPLPEVAMVLVGCGEEKMPGNCYARIKMCNFII